MEIASMVPARMPEAYNSSLHYAQYHDLRSQPGMASSVVDPTRHIDNYTPYQQQAPLPTSANPPAHANHAPTPPEDANKPSLPSISNLLGIAADGEKASSQSSGSESRSPSLSKVQVAPQPSLPTEHSVSSHDGSVASARYKSNLPPTPPMRSNSMPEGVHSPSTISSHSSFSGPPHGLDTSLGNVDAAHQRVYPMSAPMSKPIHAQPPAVYSTSPYVMQGYLGSPTSLPSPTYYSPEAMYQNGLYHQRPLPSNFPPAIHAVPMLPPGMIPTANPWEHHHYMTAGGHVGFSSVQDRYVCGTCKKAFSRPSSLKIHSHSHTGEKPFKCPHPGCGKAFSVRSNMKRHERGCHTPDMGGVPL